MHMEFCAVGQGNIIEIFFFLRTKYSIETAFGYVLNFTFTRVYFIHVYRDLTNYHPIDHMKYFRKYLC